MGKVVDWVIGPALPYLIGAMIVAGVITGAILWHNGKVSDAYDAGYAKATQESIEAAAAATKAMQDDWVAAHTADASRQSANASKFRPLKERASNAPHDPACVDAGTRQLLDEAVRAANDTAPARKSG